MQYIKSTIITIVTFPFFLIHFFTRFHIFSVLTGISIFIIYQMNINGRLEKIMTWDWFFNIGLPTFPFIICAVAFILIVISIELAITDYTEFIDDIHLNNLNNSIFSKEFRTRKSTVYYYIKKYEKEPLYKISFK